MKIRKELWNENLDAFELAKLFDCSTMTVRAWAKKNGWKYVSLKVSGRRAKGAWTLPDDTFQRIAVRKLLKAWRGGDDSAAKGLAEFGVKAVRLC